MQRERLEGWMVKQIENADLAKETVIQLPSRISTAAVLPRYAQVESAPPTSPRRAPVSPRRRLTSSSLSAAAASPPIEAESSRKMTGGGAVALPTRSPRHREFGSAEHEQSNGTSFDKQWRAHFLDPSKQKFVEQSGRVDRTKVLRWNPLESDTDDAAAGLGASVGHESASPLFLWGLPREHIVEYIRQSVLPSSWSMATKFGSEEWKAVVSGENDADTRDSLAKALASLPPLALQHKTARDSAASTAPGNHATTRWPDSTSPRGSQTARSPAKRPHTSPLHSGAAIFPTGASSTPVTPRQPTPPRSDDRITRVLNELRADPSLWEAFARNVHKYQEERRLKNKASDKIRENKQRAASPRLPATLEERKKQAEERMERTRRQRELLVRQEELRVEAQLIKYQQHFVPKKRPLTAAELANTVGYRRRKMWLMAVSFAAATAAWRAKLLHRKQLVLLAEQQSRAAETIQRIWRKWKWHHTSRHTAIIYTWLRRCMWRLLFNIRCRRRARCASVLQRFMIDHFSGSRETRNFNRMMVRWRSKVITSQRLSRDFVLCTRARLHALSLLWDRVDHERQRSERQQHDRVLPTEEKEAEWAAMLHSRKLLKRQSLQRSVASTSATGQPSSNNAPPSTPQATPSARRSNKSPAALLQLEHMDERLTSMQQVLTPIEIQRLQQNAFHIVRIAKSVKAQLLHDLLAGARKEYIRHLTQFSEQRRCATFTREVRVDDARAIVQNSLSWGSLLADGHGGGASRVGSARQRSPLFELFTGGPAKMEELVKRGVQLTLERDSEQRAVVERQRQSIDSFSLPSALAKRESVAGGNTVKRQSVKRLTFTLPPKDPPRKRAAATTTVLEDAAE